MEVWEAPQYEAALAHLERLQEQVRGHQRPTNNAPGANNHLQLENLRSAVPSIVAPLVRPATSKAQLFADVRKSAIQSTDDLKTFREQWTSEQTQQLFARSRQSLEKDGDLSKAVDVARYGWSSE